MNEDIKCSAEAYVHLSIRQRNNPVNDVCNYQNYVDDVVEQWPNCDFDYVHKCWGEAIKKVKKENVK